MLFLKLLCQQQFQANQDIINIIITNDISFNFIIIFNLFILIRYPKIIFIAFFQSFNNYWYYNTSVTIPNLVTNIDYGAFYLCSGLISVNIPNSVTEIAKNAFAWCSCISSIKIPKRFESRMNEIFYGVDLSSIKIIYTYKT